MKKILTFYVFLLLTIAGIFPLSSLASEKEAGDSAKSRLAFAADDSSIRLPATDSRADTLKRYLEKYNSPLADYADTFVKEADKNGLDWKLVAAISGVESTFAQAQPSNCYNSWGFGIYGDNVKCFPNYETAIATISKALRDDYIDKWGAKDVFEIGRFYASSQMWPYRVTYFMQDIQDFENKTQRISLPISL